MCSPKLCTRQMAISTQWDKCHEIDMNSSKSNSYFWSLVGTAPQGTPSMHSSWCEHRGACAGCRSVESHLFMEGGFVCEWQVASCSEGSPSAKHVRTHSRVDTLQDLLKNSMGLRSTNCWHFGSVISGESHPYHIRELVLQGLSTALMSWRVTMGSIGRPPWTTKIWRMEREGSNCKRILKYIVKLLGIGPQWVVSHPKWYLLGEAEASRWSWLILTTFTAKIGFTISRGAHSWYQILYSFIDFIWFHTHTANLKRIQTVVAAWSLLRGLRALGLERIISINRTSKWLAHKSRLIAHSLLDLVPIFHYVLTSIENSPITPFHFRNGAWKQ